jgi:hypothetical protein
MVVEKILKTIDDDQKPFHRLFLVKYLQILVFHVHLQLVKDVQSIDLTKTKEREI